MKRAVVLGGGGPIAIAWETALLAGLEGAGLDLLADADLVVGTSAGAVVGAQRGLGHSAEKLLDGLLQKSRAPGGLSAGQTSRTPEMSGAQRGFARLGTLLAGPEETAKPVRAQIGAFALRARGDDDQEFVEGLVRTTEIPDQPWPDRFCCTGVDAEEGTFITWNRLSGVPLDRAIAASCAVPGIFPPVRIGERRYMDGGMRSTTNADLARGHERVVVLAMAHGPLASLVQGTLARELEHLSAAGSQIASLAPDDATVEAMGPSMMDGSRAPEIAEAALAQARREVDALARLWT